MDALKKLRLLQCETNTVYEIKVNEEIYNRASTDMGFATKLLMRRINEGITEFVGSLESVDGAMEKKFSSLAGPSASSRNKTYSDAKSAIHNWTKEEVLLLISAYKEHQLQFLEDNSNKAEIWSLVVNDMTTILAENGLPPIDEKKCKTKMDTLKRHYKTVKDGNKRSGNQKITWPYFDEMEELFGEQPWVQPLSTAGCNIPNNMEAEMKNPPAKRQKKDFSERLLEERKRRDEMRERHHREKIYAVNRLTDVLAKLIKKIVLFKFI